MARRVVFAIIISLVALGASGARADGEFAAAASVARCASVRGSVPGGSAWAVACSEPGSAAYAGLPLGPDAPFAFFDPPEALIGVVHVQTSKGVDEAFFYVDPLSPDASTLTGFTMDPVMGTAHIALTAGDIKVALTLTGSGTPRPDQGSAYTYGVGTDAVVCARGGVYAGLERDATVAGTIKSRAVGGGTFAGPGSMLEGIGTGSEGSFVPAAGWLVMC